MDNEDRFYKRVPSTIYLLDKDWGGKIPNMEWTITGTLYKRYLVSENVE